MTVAPEFLLALLAMGLGSYFCRAGGFFLMRFVPVTPRLEAALKILPLGVMIGIVAPAALNGGLPERAGLIVVLVVMKIFGNDFAAALAGIAAVAILRHIAQGI